jgi:anaerobic selenocysteine-containing dehydrogenase
MNETARRFADVVLPRTAWLEELGFKVTNSHLYLMERALEREAETRPIYEILRSLANSLGLAFGAAFWRLPGAFVEGESNGASRTRDCHT